MKKRDRVVGGREQDVPSAIRIKGRSGSRIGLPRHGAEFNGLMALKCVDCDRARRIGADDPIFSRSVSEQFNVVGITAIEVHCTGTCRIDEHM